MMADSRSAGPLPRYGTSNLEKNEKEKVTWSVADIQALKVETRNQSRNQSLKESIKQGINQARNPGIKGLFILGRLQLDISTLALAVMFAFRHLTVPTWFPCPSPLSK